MDPALVHQHPDQMPTYPYPPVPMFMSQVAEGLHISLSEEIETYLAIDDAPIPGFMVPSLFAPPPSHADSDSDMRTTAFPYYLTLRQTVDPTTSLVEFKPSPTQSPLMHPAAQRLYRHFVYVVACQISLFERSVPEPERLILVVAQSATKITEHANIWAYHVPMMALKTPALLHAILAVSALHIAGLSTVSVESAAAHQHSSLLHYHLGIRRLAKSLIDRKDARNVDTVPSLANGDLGIFAASLALGYYEITTGEHDKWARHLLGASNMIRRFDIPAIIADLSISTAELDAADIAGSAAQYGSSPPEEHAAENMARARRNALRQRKADAMLFLDLLYFYLRMQIMQAISLDSMPYIGPEFWDNIPSRTTTDTIRIYDDCFKVAVRLLCFIVRESARKCGRAEPGFDKEAAQREWDTLDAAYLKCEEEFLQTRHPANGVPLEDVGASLFGPPLWYVEIQDGVLRMYLAMWRLFLIRNNPAWTRRPAIKAAMQNVRETTAQGMLSTMVICRIVAGIVLSGRLPRVSSQPEGQQQSQQNCAAGERPQEKSRSLRYVIRKTSLSLTTTPEVSYLEGKVGRSSTSAAAWVCMAVPILYAGAQITDERQRNWLRNVLEETYFATGWKTSMIIRDGLDLSWHVGAMTRDLE
ncbi:fungal-specific transcription factor domain-containing protein [Kockiozyma suomiensis]|uniref:fungal-specific transcription factor domain-containing protein n=1 Tax=Kockiozyma suomiensis TaxID=1337062 RepID=UPI003343FAE0